LVLSANVKDISSYEKEYKETRKQVEDEWKKYHNNMTASEIEHLSQELKSHDDPLNKDHNDMQAATTHFPHEEFQKSIQWCRVKTSLSSLRLTARKMSWDLTNCKPPHKE